ncbi:MAG: phage Gp37/Gp68 family protein [bacterium]|nr:phage Gp37/Gp68 family protein [bacterium]
MSTSSIEWTDATWNPVTGCTKVSPGCKNCYAERMAKRLKAMGQERYRNGFEVRGHVSALEEPLRWRKPRMVFVCSMGDLFHDDVPLEFIERVWGVMARASQHTFQVLTKRPQRMHEYLAATHDRLHGINDAAGTAIFPTQQHGMVPGPGWPLPNVWLGTSIENQETADERIPLLLDTPAVVRFVSAEPLLGSLDLSRDLELEIQAFGGNGLKCFPRIDWVICGGESGPGARPMDPDWARSLRDQCLAAEVPFLFKQWGGTNKKRAGRALDGCTWDGMPEVPA